MNRSTPSVLSRVALIGLLSGFVVPASAQISLTFENPHYSEDFNHFWAASTDEEIPWADNDTLPGWYLRSFTTGTPTFIGAKQSSLGSPVLGRTYFASHSSFPDDYMLGTRPSGSAAGDPEAGFYYAVRLANDSATAITSFSVAYDGFQWYRGSAVDPNQIVVSYQILPSDSLSDITAGTWTQIPALEWSSSVSGGAQTLNFHTTSSRVNFDPALVEGITVQPGEELWVRWHTTIVLGNNQGVGIDNVAVMTSIPEPANLPMYGALACIGWVLIRRRKVAGT